RLGVTRGSLTGLCTSGEGLVLHTPPATCALSSRHSTSRRRGSPANGLFWTAPTPATPSAVPARPRLPLALLRQELIQPIARPQDRAAKADRQRCDDARRQRRSLNSDAKRI